jgi:NADH-quinone oxidoreductase subunit F
VINKTIHFFKHESCGKCTPCREGTFWMARVIDRIESGRARDEDIDLLDAIAGQMQNKCLCALGEFSTVSVRSAIENYRADFVARLEK